MSTCVGAARAVRPSPPLTEVRERVRSLLAALHPDGSMMERRRERRYPFPQLIRATPVADDGQTPTGEPLVVVGKHLSENGLGFFHPQPLPYRRLIVSLDAGQGRSIGLLIDLTWCRFTRLGWYESGGRFLETVSVAAGPDHAGPPALAGHSAARLDAADRVADSVP